MILSAFSVRNVIFCFLLHIAYFGSGPLRKSESSRKNLFLPFEMENASCVLTWKQGKYLIHCGSRDVITLLRVAAFHRRQQQRQQQLREKVSHLRREIDPLANHGLK